MPYSLSQKNIKAEFVTFFEKKTYTYILFKFK